MAEGIFAAAERFESYRLPELFANAPVEPIEWLRDELVRRGVIDAGSAVAR